MMKKPKYHKPYIKKKKVKLNFFFTMRHMDSMDRLFGSKVFAQSGGSGGSSSVNCEKCFIAGTKIALDNNTSKNIQDVNEGDIVVTYDHKTGNFSNGQVTKLAVGPRKDGYFFINNALKVTGDHPIFANGQWIEVEKLHIGDTLLDRHGKIIRIEDIYHVSGEITTYNIHIKSANQTYFAENILVHAYQGKGDMPNSSAADILT